MSLIELCCRFAVHTSVYYEIIHLLLLSPSCPKSVLALCSPQITVLLTDKKRPGPAAPVPNSFKVTAVRQVIANATGAKLNSGECCRSHTMTSKLCLNFCRRRIPD